MRSAPCRSAPVRRSSTSRAVTLSTCRNRGPLRTSSRRRQKAWRSRRGSRRDDSSDQGGCWPGRCPPHAEEGVYVHGPFENGGASLDVSAGAGDWLPVRIFTPREVVIITLREGSFPGARQEHGSEGSQ